MVQQRQRLFREGIRQLLSAESDIEVVAMATTDAELVDACRQHHPSVVIVEADVADWDVSALVDTVRRTVPELAVIGLAAQPVATEEASKARRDGMREMLSREQGIAGIMTALRAPTDRPAAARMASMSRSAPTAAARSTLTTRELEVLSLVGAGLTSTRVSMRLNISHKTVENHKQRIFAKLGVQNQAHAVSIAMRTGLLRSDRVVDLAVGD